MFWSTGSISHPTSGLKPNFLKFRASTSLPGGQGSVIAAVNGENEYSHWIGVFKLKDGRFLIANGQCDYTGWDCRAGNTLQVGRTLSDVLQYGLTRDELLRLWPLECPPHFIPPGWREEDVYSDDGMKIAADWWEDAGEDGIAASMRNFWTERA